jgi:tRNA(fMet)-specific endonuclease VapC
LVPAETPKSTRKRSTRRSTRSRFPFGPPGAWEAVQIQHELLDRGKRIGAVDVLIAGKARSHGMTVLTRSVDEFERVDGLAVETY